MWKTGNVSLGMQLMDRRLLEHYNEELRHLRGMASEFARDFPKIAGRLSLNPDSKVQCDDPYVERLLEGVAFLAARVHLKLDAEFPRFTQGILETVYPDYLCPIPSMTIVKFEPEEQEGALAPGLVIPRGTLLRSHLGKGERTACTFTTAHNVRLLPINLTEARYFVRDLAELNLSQSLGAKAALRFRIKKTISESFKEIQADPLVFHIRGADELPGKIYEQIFSRKLRLVVQAPNNRKQSGVVLPADCIRPVGFDSNHALLPPAPHGFEGYRLLREYFVFPERFLFFELNGFQEALSRIQGDEADLIIALEEQDTNLEGRVDKSSFDLFCTPAINLFEKTLDRIPISNRVSEFHLVPDRNRALDFEVYKLTSVTGFGETPDQEQPFHPFYQAKDTDLGTSAFYAVNRVSRLLSDHERPLGKYRSDYGGTDTYISIVDGEMAPCRTDLRQLGVRALCTNRHLPIQMTKGIGPRDFELEKVSAPVAAIRILSGPSKPRASVVISGGGTVDQRIPSGRFAWRLISHLSLNYLSLLDRGAEAGAEALRDILKLYVDSNDRQSLRQIDGVRSVSSRPIVRRVQTAGPITFARGLEITLLLDESAFEGQGVFVLGAVLDEFFGRYVSLNSFTETVLTTQQRKEIMRWPARIGTRQIV
jgi:type VI secretion system protein ImpG